MALLIWGFALWKNFAFISMVNCSMRLINVLTGTCGSIVCIEGAKLIDRIPGINKGLTWVGRSTEIILIAHIFELHTGIIQNLVNKDLYGMLYFNEMEGKYIVLGMRFLWALAFAFVVRCLQKKSKNKLIVRE